LPTLQKIEQGYEQQLQNGAFLRELYVNQQLFLPYYWNPDEFYVRTTNYQRTRLSAQGLIEGLYPINMSVPNCTEYTIHFITGDTEQENMYINSEFCPKLSVIESEVKNSAEVEEYERMVSDPLLKKLGDVFVWRKAMSIDRIFDCFETHACHKLEFPEKMSPDLFSQVKATLLWFTKTINNAQLQNYTYSQIAIASFLKDILNSLESVHSGTSPVKFSLYSGHDSTIHPLLMAYQVWDGKWPSYASLVQIEMLYNDSGEFVRLIYNNEVLRLPECEYMDLCPYEKFREMTMKIIDAAVLCES